MSKKEKNKKSQLENMHRASGANYMAAMTAIAVVLVIIVNLISNAIGKNITQIDLSRKDIFTLTETSVDFLKNLSEDVEIITLAEPGSEYADLQRLLLDYEAHSDHISLSTKDPAKSPDLVSKYSANLTQGSLVVVCGERYKTIDLTDMVISKSVDDTSNYQYYEYDMEGQITNAIDYVTSEKNYKAYVLTGTGKVSLGTIQNSIQKQNIDLEEWRIEDDGAIPEDADIVILYSLTKDLTDAELTILNDYLNRGGTMFIAEEYKSIRTGTELPNYDALIARFGMSVEHVTVLEQNSSYYYTSDDGDYNFMVKPSLRKHEITQDLIDGGYELLLVASDKIDIEEKDNVEVIPLLQSSSTAYYKSKSDSTYAKLNTDPSGTFTYVAAGVETMEDGTEAKLIYSAASTLLSREVAENINNTLAKANTTFTVNCMKWLAGQEEMVYVDAKTKSYNRLVYTNDVDKKIGYITVIVPAAILATGGIIWYRRRKK